MSVNIFVRAKGARALLTKLAIKIKGGAKSLSPGGIALVCSEVIAWDTINFKNMQKDRYHNRITLPQAVFTRTRDFQGNGSVTAIMAQVSRMLPLNDTGRLWRSVTILGGEDMLINVTQISISMYNLVPYVAKHAKGMRATQSSEMFSFGTEERARLKRRVPPPKEKGTGPQVGRKKGSKNRRDSKRGVVRGLRIGEDGDDLTVRGSDTYHLVENSVKELNVGGRDQNEKGDLKSSRPYYRLRGWAENRYPTTATTKKRNWILPLGSQPLIIARIEQMIILDILENVKK